MKTRSISCLIAGLLLVAAAVHAQQYTIDWYKVAGGGGTSTGGSYTVNGTVGQPDASGTMSGGNYSVTGGFWALVNVVQTPGAPTLYISHSGNTVAVYWQAVAGWNLVQNNNLTTSLANWPTNSSASVTGGTNYVFLVNPTGNQFFKLKSQ
jgi:hypothetical protein